jgi:urea transport system substrate-binding protein
MNPKSITRRSVLNTIAASTAVFSAGFGVSGSLLAATKNVKIGFLSGMTGLETILGETQLNCFKLAVEQINATGGERIDFLVEDDQTTTRGAIDKARKLITTDNVDVIIGMIASLTHVAARSVTNPAKKLVIYPTYYEGEVCEKYFFSTGQVPNQQIYPTTEWLTQNVGKSVYVLGSDYIWPKRSTEALKSAFTKFGGKVLGAEFFPFGTQDFGPVLNRIREAKPDIVWIMVAGADQISLLKQYRSFGIKAQLVSTGLDEVFSYSHPELVEGVLSNQAYFMTLDNPKNNAFVAAYRAKYGNNKPINAIGEATYNAAWLYYMAVKKAGSTDVEKVISALKTVEFDAPQGRVNFAANNVMRSHSILAKARADGQWSIIKDFGQIDPVVVNCKL